MTLAEVFAEGHHVATSRGTSRYVVQCPAPPAPNGWWLIRPDAVPAVMYRRQVTPKDLGGSLGVSDLQGGRWVADADHCWCPECSASRKMLETHED